MDRRTQQTWGSSGSVNGPVSGGNSKFQPMDEIGIDAWLHAQHLLFNGQGAQGPGLLNPCKVGLALPTACQDLRKAAC